MSTVPLLALRIVKPSTEKSNCFLQNVRDFSTSASVAANLCFNIGDHLHLKLDAFAVQFQDVCLAAQ